jgi:hypothetical protein
MAGTDSSAPGWVEGVVKYLNSTGPGRRTAATRCISYFGATCSHPALMEQLSTRMVSCKALADSGVFL